MSEVRVWYHTTKGRIAGEVVGSDDTWTHIRLSENAWADVRHQHLDPPGSVQTYRTSRLVEMSASVSVGEGGKP